MRKLCLILCMLFGLSLCATAQSTTEIFTIDFGSDGTAFYLIEFDEVGVAAFLDTKDSDVNILICDPAEIKQIKKIAYESKLLVKSVTTLEQYESQKIPQTIVKKFQDFGSVTKEEYGEFDDLGFARIRYFITQKTYAKHKDKFDNLSMIDTFNQLNGLGGSKDTDSSSKLVVWSFTDEIEGMIKNYYQPAHPDMLIEYSMTPTDQFPSKLDPPLASGYNCPDVVSLEDAFARRYIESDLLLPLDDVYAEIQQRHRVYLGRYREQPQYVRRRELAYPRRDGAAQHRYHQRGVYGFLHALLVLHAYVPRYHDVRTYRNAHEEVYYQRYKRRVAAYRSHCVLPDPVPDNGYIRGVEKLLQYPRSGKRQREAQYALSETACQYIIFLFHLFFPFQIMVIPFAHHEFYRVL